MRLHSLAAACAALCLATPALASPPPQGAATQAQPERAGAKGAADPRDAEIARLQAANARLTHLVERLSQQRNQLAVQQLDAAVLQAAQADAAADEAKAAQAAATQKK